MSALRKRTVFAAKWRLLIGYARVSTDEQDTAAQVAALKAAGCERIYREKASGGRWDRPQLHRLLDQLRKGDVLVVWKLDRLSRSLRDVLVIMERLAGAKAGFRSLTEAIDTTTWSPKAAKPPPTQRGCSKSTPPPSRNCWQGHLARPQGRPRMPSNVDGSTPFNSESDSGKCQSCYCVNPEETS
ncbi:hypothetical protein SBA4_290030 [Candidatus Sulfopaludibacter sp. SbA4]|nr:hypothetical protein SBA4_290030 [Candidatus Sulfopaludibacter sp. SbA4]